MSWWQSHDLELIRIPALEGYNIKRVSKALLSEKSAAPFIQSPKNKKQISSAMLEGRLNYLSNLSMKKSYKINVI